MQRHTEIPDSRETEHALRYRVVCAWVERISSAPFSRFSDDPDSRWTARCRLEDPLVEDYKNYFGAMKSAGFNHMVVWGLFGENWPVDPAQGIPLERADRVRRILRYAHQYDVCILVGFSVGYQVRSLLTARPELALGAGGENPSRTCVDCSRPDSVKWTEETLRYLLDNFDIAGFSLESPWQMYTKIMRFVRSCWPDKIFMCYARPLLQDAKLFPQLKDAAELADFFDVDLPWREPDQRAEVLALDLQIAQRNNTLGSRWVTPPWCWDRLRWFLPQVHAEARSIKEAHTLGANGYYCTAAPLNNPGIEIDLAFRGRLLLDPTRDARGCLETVLTRLYRPRTEAALATLVDVVEKAEAAYPWSALPPTLHTESFDYLNRLSPDELAGYGKTFQQLRDMLDKVKREFDAEDKVQRLLECLENVLRDVADPPGYPDEVRLRMGTVGAAQRTDR